MSRPRTIFSLSTAAGKAGVAVIRISGPESFAAATQISGALPKARVASLRTLRDPESGMVLDEALVLRFDAGASFTGEDSVEFQIHGGRAVIQSVLTALGNVVGLRVAEAGEFTRRAFENGRLDLAQVESLGDLIDSETEHQRQQAMNGYGGLLGVRVREWRSLVLEAKALVAAEIDFSDEGDVGENAASGIDSLLEQLKGALEGALATADQGRMVQEGFRVALVGAPNVGKSTLLNCLARSDVAIVTEHAGTTRDVIEVKMDISGYSVILQDTAGLRATDDPVEQIGIERTKRAAVAADLVLLLGDHLGFAEINLPVATARSIRVRTKQDILDPADDGEIGISAVTGFGIDSLMERIRTELHRVVLKEPVLVTRLRQRQCIEAALHALTDGRRLQSSGVEFVDDALRRVDVALAELLGQIHVEDVLGAVFSRFCVGK